MREILEQCVRMDEFARDAYVRLAEVSEDPALRSTLETLAREEADHVTWWRELLESWEEGLLPDIVSQPAQIVDELTYRWERMVAAAPEELGTPSAREIVTIATRLEFFMLVPVFDELLDLVEPMQSARRHAAYRRHLEHLTETIERVAGDDPLVHFLAQVLQRAAQDNRTLSQFATHDALTGLRNRRSLNSHLQQWLAWSARYGRPLGVLLIDLDSFKDINDGHGHETGDRVLATVAKTLASTVRGADIVARYGGDEFAVLSPETGDDELAALAARLVEAVRAVEITLDDGEQLDVSVSIGVTVVRSSRMDITPEAALSVADQSLYDAKEAGRDRAGAVRNLPEAG